MCFFVNYCLKEAGYTPASSFMSAGAVAIEKDKFCQLESPAYGAMCLTRRTGGNHICFVYGLLGNNVIVLGGNQGDMISFVRKGKSGAKFFVPIAYLEYAKKDLDKMSQVDVDALRSEYGPVVRVSKKPVVESGRES